MDLSVFLREVWISSLAAGVQAEESQECAEKGELRSPGIEHN